MTTIQALHDSAWQGVLHITGGGGSVLSELLAVPGASRTLLDATIPYANAALTQLLGGVPEQAASSATARALAMAGYQRAKLLGNGDLFGLGCTASLVTDRSKRGSTRAHWVIQTAAATEEYCLPLSAAATRSEQEQALRQAIIDSLGMALLGQPTTAALTGQHLATEAWQPLLGDSPYRWCRGAHDGLLILPGSFNPVHDGHYQMLAAAEQFTGMTGAFELTLRNADKPDLDYLSAAERLEAISGQPVWLTNQASFAAKAELFPTATFVLGTDTMARIGEPRFYHNSLKARDEAIESLHRLGIRFLVLGRIAQQRFVTLADLALPERLAELCTGVPESVYRNDLSSTQLRAANRPGSRE